MTQIEQVMATLKRRILAGEFQAGSRLMEMPIAESLGVSRTPVRLALGLLEREGLVETAGPKRGFTIRTFQTDDVFSAIAVRGTLEGMAARLAAEKGLSDQLAERLRACLASTEDLVRQGVDGVEQQKLWVGNNVEFHRILCEASGNAMLIDLIDRCNSLPLVGPAAINFASEPDQDVKRFERVFEDHAVVAAAILGRQGTRAEMLVREHAEHNIENKRQHLERLHAGLMKNDLPGATLIAEKARKTRRRPRPRSTLPLDADPVTS